jgi:hypothetical protein
VTISTDDIEATVKRILLTRYRQWLEEETARVVQETLYGDCGAEKPIGLIVTRDASPRRKKAKK